MKKTYIIQKRNILPESILNWDALDVDVATIDQYHPESSNHQPLTQIKIVWDDMGIFVLFKVVDKYIRSTYTAYNSKVHEDSCVEWFIKPPKSKGYYNFEVNAGGTLHVNYIVDPERDNDGKRKNLNPIPEDHAEMISIHSSLPRVIEPELQEDRTWYLSIRVPFKFFDLYSPVNNINSSVWQGNLYKCGDKTSHPHWGFWNSIKALNFHQPKSFGEFRFVERE